MVCAIEGTGKTGLADQLILEEFSCHEINHHKVGFIFHTVAKDFSHHLTNTNASLITISWAANITLGYLKSVPSLPCI